MTIPRSSMRDLDVRSALRERLGRTLHKEPGSKLIDELGVCQGLVRIDVALVNGLIHGHEIKSASDTLVRLPTQVEFYGKCLHKATLVVAASHLDKAGALLPTWWGVLEAKDSKTGVKLREARKADHNPSIEPYCLAQFLWRDEVLEVLSQRGMDDGVRSKPKRELWNRLAERLSLQDLSACVLASLKARAVPAGPQALSDG